MARQSIPANPVDEQILALQRQLANLQNELDSTRDDGERELAEARKLNERIQNELSQVLNENRIQLETIRQLEVDQRISNLIFHNF